MFRFGCGTVMRPARSGCRNCQWLPRTATRTQPSRSSNRISLRLSRSTPIWCVAYYTLRASRNSVLLSARPSSNGGLTETVRCRRHGEVAVPRSGSSRAAGPTPPAPRPGAGAQVQHNVRRWPHLELVPGRGDHTLTHDEEPRQNPTRITASVTAAVTLDQRRSGVLPRSGAVVGLDHEQCRVGRTPRSPRGGDAGDVRSRWPNSCRAPAR